MPIITQKQLNQDRSPEDIDNDTYPTPEPLVRAALRLLKGELYTALDGGVNGYTPTPIQPFIPLPQRILDPGAGAGIWGKVAREIWPQAYIVGVELNKAPNPDANVYDWWHDGVDYREFDPGIGFDLVIGNPPYGKSDGKKDRKLAEKFVRRSISFLNPGGHVLFLLKSVFRHGSGRNQGLFVDHPYMAVFDSASRVSFFKSARGASTNDVDYSLFFWKKGWKASLLDRPVSYAIDWHDGVPVVYL